MSDFFDRTLHFLGQNQKTHNVFVINIGAMDGIMFDEMHGYSTMYNFRGLYVEPIPYLFEKLVKNMGPENSFENSAIADYDGEIEMIMIDPKAIDNGLVHCCFYGMSAVYPPKNGLGSESDKPTVEKYGRLIKVPCVTFPTLMSKHHISEFDVVKIDAEGHDYKIFKQIDLVKYKPKVVRLEWINLSDTERENIIATFDKHDYVYDISQDITGVARQLYDQLEAPSIPPSDADTVTLVTGLWDIKRSELEGDWARQYQNYLDNFARLLEIDHNMIIFGDKSLEAFVWQRRKPSNTMFVLRDLEWFKHNEYYDQIQKIRTDPQWFSQIDWLRTSPQAKLHMYNPIVMSKMFLLNDARILDPFNSSHMFWIDAGLSFTVHPGYFTHDKVLLKLPNYITKFTFVVFPYVANTEIHGFAYDKICIYANSDVNKIARGGFFGGPVRTIAQINSIYYHLLTETLGAGCMGTEESIFSIMMYKYPHIVSYAEIMPDGLLYKFFEDLKNDNIVIKHF